MTITPPITLPRSLASWDRASFAATLSDELCALGETALPLQRGVTHGGYADGSNLHLSLLSASADTNTITARLSVFFTEIIINCGCGDDPMPVDAYCVMEVKIDRGDARMAVEVVEE